jgi:hypothetical protein
MKSEVIVGDVPVSEPKFPALYMWDDYVIVLFWGVTQGTCVWLDGDRHDWKLGEMSNYINCLEGDWKRLPPGTKVTLENDC